MISYLSGEVWLTESISLTGRTGEKNRSSPFKSMEEVRGGSHSKFSRANCF